MLPQGRHCTALMGCPLDKEEKTLPKILLILSLEQWLEAKEKHGDIQIVLPNKQCCKSVIIWPKAYLEYIQKRGVPKPF